MDGQRLIDNGFADATAKLCRQVVVTQRTPKDTVHDILIVAPTMASAAAAAAPEAVHASPGRKSDILDGLDLHPCLRERINEVYPPALSSTSNSNSSCATNASSG